METTNPGGSPFGLHILFTHQYSNSIVGLLLKKFEKAKICVLKKMPTLVQNYQASRVFFVLASYLVGLELTVTEVDVLYSKQLRKFGSLLRIVHSKTFRERA